MLFFLSHKVGHLIQRTLQLKMVLCSLMDKVPLLMPRPRIPQLCDSRVITTEF